MPDSDKSEIEAAVAALREALEGDDTAAITAKSESLSQAAMKLGEAMYKAQQEEAAAGEGMDMPDGDGAEGPDMGSDGGGADDDATVVDADFEEVDDERRDKSA